MIIDYLEYNGAKYYGIDTQSSPLPSDVLNNALLKQGWAKVRTRRDELLHASDYAVMPDYPLTDEQLAAVKQYRQALRDIPETADDPDAIEWPEKPEVLTQ